MKTICKLLLSTFLVLISVNGVVAQTSQPKPNQVELMKQFIGTWQCELGKDTILVTENTPFGTGMMCSSEIVSNGKKLESIKQLFGYDRKLDKFIVAELIKSSPVIEICNAWFTSSNKGELVIVNPENAPVKWKFEFKTPDLIVQTAIINNRVVKEVLLSRKK